MAAGNIQKCRLDPAQGRPLGPAAFLYICVYFCMFVYICVFMCIFMYICVYLCIYIYIYIYIYISATVPPGTRWRVDKLRN